MPKPLKVMLEVEEAYYGKVWRTLDAMPGVVTLMPISEGVKQPGEKKQRQKKGGTQSVYCLILGALAQPNVQNAARDYLVQVCEEAGKKATSVPDALMKMRKAKHVKSTGKGRDVKFTITAAGRKHFETACQIEGVE